MQLNFDADCDPQDVEADAITRGDYEVPPVHRHYARLWLRRDYDTSPQLPADTVGDVDPVDHDLAVGKPPPSGMQVNLGAMYYGLFFHLKSVLRHVERTRFFLDLDPGLGTACLAGFSSEVRERRCDAFLVRGGKQLTVDKKKLKVAQANQDLARFIKTTTLPDGESPQHHFVMARLKEHLAKDDGGKWFEHPLADMADSTKSVQYLTDFRDYDIGRLANLYMLASLRGVDRFFMLVRRRLSLLERPISTANNSNRTWHGYAAYSPVVAQRVLNIFRCYHNYCLVGEDKKTPAMRLGLAEGPVPVDVLANSHSR
jgi:hypothetical protein